MPSSTTTPPPVYSIGIVGSGLGGLSAAIALRRAGHAVTIYERFDFGGEVGASLSLASNGSRLLEAWGVDVPRARPVVLRELVRHDWSSGAVLATYPLGDYRARFGTDYNNFHRVDLHRLLQRTALGPDGAGPPATLRTWHRATALDPATATVRFADGAPAAAHDALVCADGIRSAMRAQLGVRADVAPSASCCYRCTIPRDRLAALGLAGPFADKPAIAFWGGDGDGPATVDKIVLSPCAAHAVVSCYCFYAAARNDLTPDGWDHAATGAKLADTFPTLDPRLRRLFAHADDVRMWRLYDHREYTHWTRGAATLLGDAAHPMMPDQSQGACMAVEDAGALGMLFADEYADVGVRDKLALYERVRKPRATRLQDASRRARTDITERIGWSSASDRPGKLTIEEVCGYDMHAHVAEVVAAWREERTGQEAHV